MQTQSQSIYRRDLPDTCVALSSQEGRRLFKQSLLNGHADSFMELSQFWSTQADPAFCGLGTLTSILNSLGVDPQRAWKGPWRWYADEMLDCCRSLESIREAGVTLDEFVCIARCNGLSVDSCRAADRSVDEFERDLVEACGSTDTFLTVSYSRRVLKQTGDGHFSPVGAYHQESRLVLIMDIARFKYPCHWVPIDVLFEAMSAVDAVTGKCRGYAVMRKQSPVVADTLFHLPFNKQSWRDFLRDLNGKLDQISDVDLSLHIKCAIGTEKLFRKGEYTQHEESMKEAALATFVLAFDRFLSLESATTGNCHSPTICHIKDKWKPLAINQQIVDKREVDFISLQMAELFRCCET